MKTKLSMAGCMILGSFLIYCGSGGDHFAGDAMGDSGTTCTTTPPMFTKLAEGDLAANSSSQPIAVGAYREVVVYVSGVTTAACTSTSLFAPAFRPDANTPFGFTGQTIIVSTSVVSGGRLRVDGADLMLKSIACPAHFVVAGVQ